MAFHMNGYSNFHELNIEWFLKKFAEFYSEYAQFKIDWANIQDDWEAQQQAFTALQNFVNDYFDNLDVQQEINNKLNEMAEDGSLWEIMQPYVDEELDLLKLVVTPQMFGAVADGVHDDTEAVEDALNNEKPVFFPIGKYMLSRPVEINKDRVNMKGSTYLTKTGAAVSDGVTIKPLNGFNGDYLLKFNGHSYGGQVLNESIQIENITFDCNNMTGGIYAPVLYDGCMFKTVSILNVGFGYYGFNSPAFVDSITQTVDIENVWITGTRGTSSDSSDKPLFNAERWQECVFTNVKVMGTNTDCFHLYGCIGLLFNMCSVAQRKFDAGVFSTGGSGVGFKLRPFIREPYTVQANVHHMYNNCLNEGCEKPFDIVNNCQILTGNYPNYQSIDKGSEVTQGNNKGYVISITENVLTLSLDETSEYFTNGSCSAGTITANIPFYPCGGLDINNHRILGIPEVIYRIEGVSDSKFKIARSGDSITQKLSAVKNSGVLFEYPFVTNKPLLFDFENSTLDGTVEIKTTNTITFEAVSGENINLPKTHRGLRCVIKNNTSAGVNVQAYANNNIDGYTTLAYYGKLIELIAVTDTTLKTLTGNSAIPITAISGATVSENKTTKGPDTVNLSVKLEITGNSFVLNTSTTPRTTTFFPAYNVTKEKTIMCYVSNNGNIASAVGADISSGDIVYLNTSFEIANI